ncbi:cytochrome b N-terminal domain-containing protein [Roseateles oligotrophus]|uniref:Hydrogenase iron-sulfur subunit n=1 Tax=Roseateles oligotrophus TaxID=1769250 RepID=A0ABT2Y9V3_9BURK|nr:cytochrome b N-terminal domain-containing protein [Roseateles oligotrophus]MCV2367053.1 hydrogenase iron-sulfur subunit [Roseateles oligotrophus]
MAAHAIHAAGPLRKRLLPAWQRLERGFDQVFGANANPLRQLGGLGFLFFAWLLLSGIYLFAMLDSSATAAYASIARLERLPWSAGGWLRGVHRYAADAFVLVMLLHLLREWLLGRYQGFRRYSWLTGVPLLLFVFISGVVGFWLNWDRLGQYSAVATAEWLDALPIFATPLARNFLNVAAVGDRLFSLFIFIHLGLPLLLLFGLWFHIQRLTLAAVLPPRGLALRASLGLLMLAGMAPVRSQGQADLTQLGGALNFDWFLLFLHPLTDAIGAAPVWALLLGVMLSLFALPFLAGRGGPLPARHTAEVDPANCNGCRRCVVDCPYAAVTMVPHPDWQTPGRPIRQLAQVDADLCASCGICVGACPSATPFRSGVDLLTGIDMPQQPLDGLRRRLEAGLAALAGPHKFVVIGCERGPRGEHEAAADVLTLNLICTGMLPPSFIEYALRGGAAGVVISGCLEGDCAFRFGQRWTEQRLSGQREPRLRASVPREQVLLAWPSPAQPRAVSAALQRLRSAAAGRPAAGTFEESPA